MKKTLLGIIILWITTTNSFGQGFFLEGGYGMQFSKPDGLNYVVDRYNETRPYLTEEMKHFNNLNGVNYGFLAIVGNIAFEAVYIHRSQNRSAIGFDATNQEIERRLRVAMNGAGLGLGLGFAEDGFGLMVGSRLNTSVLKVRTKVGDIDEIKDEEWEDIYDQLHFDLDINVKLIFKFLVIEPYYSFQLFPSLNNMYEVNEAINPNTFQSDPEEIPFKSNGFGLKFMLAIGG